MNIIEFDVNDIGHFKAKDSLTVIEENNLDIRTNELCSNNYHELKARARELQKKGHDDLAHKIYFQVLVAQRIAELEAAVLEMPESITSIGAIEDYDSLFAIWDEYKKNASQTKKT